MSLPVHIFAETFSIVVSMMVFGVVWNAYSIERPGAVVLLGCALLAVGLLDFAHTMSFAGIPAGGEKGINFWLSARLLFALAILYVALRPGVPLVNPSTRYWLLAGGLTIAALVYWLGLFYQSLWPRTFIEGEGLTPFKIGAEYTIIAILLLPAVLFYRQGRNRLNGHFAANLFAAVVITILSELCFTLYSGVTDIFNLLGHVYKIVAYIFIYRAVFVVSVKEPFRKLQRAEERYAMLAELAPVGIFHTDITGNCLYVNERWSEIAGLSQEEAEGRGWENGLHPEDRERVGAEWYQAARESRSFVGEYRFLDSDGKVSWVYGQARAEFDGNNKVIGYVGSITDITERKGMEGEIRRERDNFTNILNTMDDGMYIVGQDYDIQYVNPALTAGFGDYLGRKCYEYFHDRHEPCTACPNKEVFAGKVVHWDWYSEKTKRHYDLVDTPLRNADGTISKLEIFRDVTDRVLAQDELRKAKVEWERTFDAISDVITILDPEFRITLANQAAADLAGVERHSLLGKFCYQVFRNQDTPCPECPVLKTLDDFDGHCEEVERQELGKTFIVSSAPIFDEQEKFVGIVHSAKDITENKKLSMQLRQAQKMESIGTLAGGIAHDFNNILTVIFGFTQLAMAEEDAEKRRDGLVEVYKAAERAGNLVRQILTFSRKLEQQQQPLQVSLIVKEAMKMLRASIPSTIDFRQKISSEAMVMADPTQIHQVVMNLCTNAYHAMREEGGVLAVSLEEVEVGADDYDYVGLAAGRYLKLDVGDTGCGIDSAIQEKIFEPYFTTKELGEGTGMGLAVVHGIVKSHRGHITLYSEPGKGTIFHVYLPVCEQVAVASTVKPSLAPTGAGERILFVDDEEPIRAMVDVILSRNGYLVTSFTSPEETLQVFEQQPDQFDLVMTDMTMPHLNGAELAKRMLTIRPELPVILCTGMSTLVDRKRALAMGIRDYLTKPFSKQTLLAAIHRALNP